MQSTIRPGEVVIDDGFNDNDHLFPATFGRGYTERDAGDGISFDPPSDIELIPESEYEARIKEIEETQSGISHILLRNKIDALNQGKWGYCWAHSTTGCGHANRALKRLPHVPLSAFSVAATIKRGANEGGWCGLSCKFEMDKGWMPQSIWPQGDVNYGKYDTPENWATASKYKITQQYYDLQRHEYDQVFTWQQVISCLLLRIPVAADFNWWSHSVMLCDVVWVNGAPAIRFRNSWGNEYGQMGFNVLQGSKARPNNAVAIRSVGTIAA